MTAGVFGRVPRVALLVGVVVLATATLTFAATSTVTSTTPAATPEAVKPQTLVVPDVRRQAYVFAKGTLEQAGFAWRVTGAVKGYAANVVTAQTPAPGAKVVGLGAPTIVLRLSSNGAYEQEGSPGERLAVRRHTGASRRGQAEGAGEDEVERRRAQGDSPQARRTAEARREEDARGPSR